MICLGTTEQHLKTALFLYSQLISSLFILFFCLCSDGEMVPKSRLHRSWIKTAPKRWIFSEAVKQNYFTELWGQSESGPTET